MQAERPEPAENQKTAIILFMLEKMEQNTPMLAYQALPPQQDQRAAQRLRAADNIPFR